MHRRDWRRWPCASRLPRSNEICARGLNPLLWGREHPWLTIAASTVGGFAAAAALIPSKEEQTLARLRRLREAMEPSEKPSQDDKHSKTAKAAEGAIGGLLLRQVIGLIRPVIVSLLRGATSAQKAQADPLTPTPRSANADTPGSVLPI